MKKFLLYLVLSTLIACGEVPQNLLEPAEGISLQLAQFRKKQVSDVIYQLTFAIPADIADSIPSEVNINMSVHDLSQPVYLDFSPDHSGPLTLTVNNQSIPTIVENGHVAIPNKYLNQGPNSVSIQFIAGELSLNRNADYLYTLLVPARASTLFPCFDQPDIKAKYVLKILAPDHWKVLAGAPLDHQQRQGSLIEHQFQESDKMSTYLFSFVAGEFKQLENEHHQLPMTMLYRETDTLKITTSLSSIFDLHRLSLNFLENYTGYPFPFKKLDFATIPGYQYGGMEHVGAIQYRESSLFLDSSATLSQKLNRAKLIAHESSHMWFGDLVTMKWFDDVWLKEVFANLMADKIINPAFPDVDHPLQFITAHYPAAYSVDRTDGTHPIRQQLNNLKDAGSLYGSIIYHKAPIMMRQLEATLGPENFRKGLATYIQTYANGNADWNDLITILDSETPDDLQQWSKVWVNSPGRPIITGRIDYDMDQHIGTFEVSQTAEDGTSKIWPQLFDITLVYPDSSVVLSINSNQQNTLIPNAVGLPKPDRIIYNSNGLGYGLFPVDIENLTSIPNISDPVARGYSYLNCYENTLNGNIPAVRMVQLLQKGLQLETNDLILRLITDETATLFWKYLTNTQKAEQLPALLKILFSRLQSDQAPNIKKDLFNLFKLLATTDEAREQLYQIWSKQMVIPNLILNQNDFTDLAMHLALYQHPLSAKVLSTTRGDIRNPDRLKRFEFLLPALSDSSSARSSYFKSFEEVSSRAMESWVLTACYFIHHPLRQKEAIHQLKLSLDLLEEIQQTGDIFFPKGWLDNTIGMYSSKEALDILEEFVDSNPNLNPQLKLKLWQAADHLKRVQSLTNPNS